MNLPIELQTRIYDHIGAVKRYLDEVPADEQREILQSLETHIHDALESRSDGEPTLELLEAILAEMDPPESYGSSQQSTAVPSHPIREQSSMAAIKARGNPLNRLALTLLIAFISFFLIIAGVTAVYLMRSSRPVMAHVESGSPLGSWKSIDFVEKTEQFKPSSMHFQGALHLKGLTFLDGGKTSESWWTWKNDKLIHHGDKSAAQFSIRLIDGTQYMFLEWLSGDVLEKGMPPKYYVLKRGAYDGSELDQTIIEGVGWGDCRVGASREEMIAALGDPTYDKRRRDDLFWKPRNIECTMRSDKKVHVVRFNRGYTGTTSAGIRIGSTEYDLMAAYGEPELTYRHDDLKMFEWRSKGVGASLTPKKGVHQIFVFRPF